MGRKLSGGNYTVAHEKRGSLLLIPSMTIVPNLDRFKYVLHFLTAEQFPIWCL